MTTKRKIESKNDNLSATFFLKEFLKYPICSRKLSVSFSKGSWKKYQYYHCKGRCPTRINANLINTKYEESLLKLRLSTNALPIFNDILKDWNTNTQKTSYELENRQLKKTEGCRVKSISSSEAIYFRHIKTRRLYRLEEIISY